MRRSTAPGEKRALYSCRYLRCCGGVEEERQQHVVGVGIGHDRRLGREDLDLLQGVALVVEAGQHPVTTALDVVPEGRALLADLVPLLEVRVHRAGLADVGAQDRHAARTVTGGNRRHQGPPRRFVVAALRLGSNPIPHDEPCQRSATNLEISHDELLTFADGCIEVREVPSRRSRQRCASVRVRDARTGQRLQRLRGQSPISALTQTHRGKRCSKHTESVDTGSPRRRSSPPDCSSPLAAATTPAAAAPQPAAANSTASTTGGSHATVDQPPPAAATLPPSSSKYQTAPDRDRPDGGALEEAGSEEGHVHRLRRPIVCRPQRLSQRSGHGARLGVHVDQRSGDRLRLGRSAGDRHAAGLHRRHRHRRGRVPAAVRRDEVGRHPVLHVLRDRRASRARTTTSTPTATTRRQRRQYSKVLVDWIINDSGGKANGLVVNLPAFPILSAQADGAKAAVRQLQRVHREVARSHARRPDQRRNGERHHLLPAVEPRHRLPLPHLQRLRARAWPRHLRAPVSPTR